METVREKIHVHAQKCSFSGFAYEFHCCCKESLLVGLFSNQGNVREKLHLHAQKNVPSVVLQLTMSSDYCYSIHV